MPGPRPILEGVLLDQLVAEVDARKSSANGMVELWERLSAESQALFGCKVGTKTLRRAYDKRRAEIYHALKAGDPVRIADAQRLAVEAAGRNLEAAKRLAEGAERNGIAVQELPGGPQPIRRRATGVQELASLARGLSAATLEAVLRKLNDPSTSARDVGELVAKCGELAVTMSALADGKDDELDK